MTSAVKYHLKLFLADITPKKQNAIDYFKEILGDRISSSYQLEIIDVLLHPEIATKEDILITPTLIRITPQPTTKLILDLANTKALAETVNIILDPPPNDEGTSTDD